MHPMSDILPPSLIFLQYRTAKKIRFMYSQKGIGGPIVGIYKSLTDTWMNVGTGNETAQFRFWEYFVLNFQYSAFAVRSCASFCVV